MAAVARAVSLVTIETLKAGGSAGQAAVALIGDEWDGFAIDFISNAYATRVSSGAERLFGSGPGASYQETGLALDFTDNSLAVKV